ncbi:MAG: hypothetical protein NVS1B12_00650 [Acidimicrobiales bacterium]
MRLGRLPARWPTYALLVGSMLTILVGGFLLPAAIGTADRSAAPPVTSTLVAPGPPVDHDPRPEPQYAAAPLVTSPPPAGVALRASDVGVTATTVTIGVVLPSLGSVAAFGVDVSQLDPKIQRTYWDAAVARVNASGGVVGRTLDVTYATGDILSADSMRAACRSLTEDHKVFAVANVLGVTGDPILCFTKDHATPYVGVDGAAPSFYPSSDGRLVTLEPDVTRTLGLFFDRMGAEIAGHTVGIVHPGSAPGLDGAALRTTLLAHGAKAVIDGPLGDQDPLIVSGQVAGAERRMQQGGADVVILLTNAVYGTVFATQADQGRYTPTYLMSDLGYATAGDSFLANMPASFFKRALAVTTTEVGRGRSNLPESALDAGCRHDYEHFANKPVARDSADGAAAIASCAVVQVLTMGLTAAGPNPTRAAFSTGLVRTGPFALPGFGRGFLGPGRLDVADQVSLLAGHADCQCWFAIDGVRPAGP